MIPRWFVRELDRRGPKNPYLKLDFLSVDKPIVVEFCEGRFLEFEITNYRIDDDGVGSFEYHGFKGNHSRPFVFVTNIELTAVNGEMPSPILKKIVDMHFGERRIVASCEELPS